MSNPADMNAKSTIQTPPPYPAQTYIAPSPVHYQSHDIELQQNVASSNDQPQARNPATEKMSYGEGHSYESLFILERLNGSPAPVQCPHCNHRGITRVEFHSGNYTHAWCLGLSCVACLCCWIPYVVDAAKNVDHYCEQCGTHLVTWHRSGRTEVVKGTQKQALGV